MLRELWFPVFQKLAKHLHLMLYPDHTEATVCYHGVDASQSIPNTAVINVEQTDRVIIDLSYFSDPFLLGKVEVKQLGQILGFV